MVGRPDIPLNEKPEKPREKEESTLSRLWMNLRMYKISTVYRDYEEWLNE